jgi:hypothetical protein
MNPSKASHLSNETYSRKATREEEFVAPLATKTLASGATGRKASGIQ